MNGRNKIPLPQLVVKTKYYINQNVYSSLKVNFLKVNILNGVQDKYKTSTYYSKPSSTVEFGRRKMGIHCQILTIAPWSPITGSQTVGGGGGGKTQN